MSCFILLIFKIPVRALLPPDRQSSWLGRNRHWDHPAKFWLRLKIPPVLVQFRPDSFCSVTSTQWQIANISSNFDGFTVLFRCSLMPNQMPNQILVVRYVNTTPSIGYKLQSLFFRCTVYSTTKKSNQILVVHCVNTTPSIGNNAYFLVVL